MINTIIEAENLSKHYQLGELHSNTNSIREHIANSVNKYIKRIFSRYLSLSNYSQSDKERHSPLHISKEPIYIWAIKNLSFKVDKGEIIGIIGNNGAGKSTLLKILSRITKPTTGKAIIKGRVRSLLEVGTGFHPELTGRENVFLNGSILGMKKHEILEKFDEIIDFAKIRKFIDTPVKRYSSGMYMRLAFAVAAHLDSEILIIDEVLAVGDIAFQKKCLGKIEKISNSGRTIIFVSHNMSSIRNLCDRVFWIDEGKIINSGPPKDVIRKYEESQIINSDNNSHCFTRDITKIRDTSFYINQVRIFNNSGQPTNVISYDSTISMTIDLKGSPVEDHFGVEFKIYKSSGEFACTGTSGPMHGVYFNKTIRQIKLDIGPLTLSSGKYYLLLSIMYGDNRVDIWENASVFHIIECFPFVLPQEIKTPVCVIQHSFTPIE